MTITYEQNGDYLIPNLEADPQPKEPVTKYGMLRERFLKEKHHGIYSAYLLKGTLKKHLLEIQTQAEERMDDLMTMRYTLNNLACFLRWRSRLAVL